VRVRVFVCVCARACVTRLQQAHGRLSVERGNQLPRQRQRPRLLRRLLVVPLLIIRGAPSPLAVLAPLAVSPLLGVIVRLIAAITRATHRRNAGRNLVGRREEGVLPPFNITAQDQVTGRDFLHWTGPGPP
jgi:hypothetical protein